MSEAYVVGHITVKHPDLWSEYRSKVPETLVPWSGEVVFRGKRFAVFAGEHAHQDIVVIRFPGLASANGWFASPAYQALIPLREKAADVTLLAYES